MSASDPVAATDVRTLAGRNGIRLVADVAGDPVDPPVLLFHGGGQTRHSWGTTMNDLAAGGWFVASVDQRGHGESDWAADGDYRLDAFADDVVEVAAAFDRPVLVGASLGGIASLAAIGSQHDRPLARALVLVDVAPNVEPEGAQRIGRFMRQHMEDGFASLDEVADAIQSYNPHRPRPKNLDGLRRNLRQRDGRWFWHWDPAFIAGRMGSEDETRTSISLHEQRASLDAAARSLSIPVLLVRGGQSDLLSEEGAQQFLAIVPHAEFADVAGAGHMVAGDRNDAFNEAIVSFLRRLPSETELELGREESNP